jgi:hypothetical protein
MTINDGPQGQMTPEGLMTIIDGPTLCTVALAKVKGHMTSEKNNSD